MYLRLALDINYGQGTFVEVKKQKLSLVTTLDSKSKPNGSTAGTLPNQFSAYKKMQAFKGKLIF